MVDGVDRWMKCQNHGIASMTKQCRRKATDGRNNKEMKQEECRQKRHEYHIVTGETLFA